MMPGIHKYLPVFLLGSLFLKACSQERASPAEEPFTIVMIPDTQNYVDYTLQKAEGFAIDSSEIFIKQMQHIAGKSTAQGGDVVFVAAVGDVWQHLSANRDPEHLKRGIGPLEGADESFSALIKPEQTLGIEIPKSIEGYQLISAAGIPFGVAPGNHDYDAWWSAKPADPTPAPGTEALPDQVHIGGLANFRRAFGSDTDFFRDKPWYVSAYRGGNSSAQVFSAGAFRFLHLALEMQAGDEVLAWAQGVVDDYPGLPTLISTHDYLSPLGERKPYAYMDLSVVDPGHHNSAEQLWHKFIRKNPQIFLVLSGHQFGQALRIDHNDAGQPVYQMLADYQARGQAGVDAGASRGTDGAVTGIGDGWYRELRFFLTDDSPRIDVRTYSSHYHAYANQLPTYSEWYKQQEQPALSDEEFVEADHFTIDLKGFTTRYTEMTQGTETPY